MSFMEAVSITSINMFTNFYVGKYYYRNQYAHVENCSWKGEAALNTG
jgi:hypothetical protein